MEQDSTEFKWMMERVKGAKSYLEIGSRLGASLRETSKYLSPGAKIRSVELVFDKGLQDTVDELKQQGFDVKVYFGNSSSPEAIQWAEDNGPYDFIFIDGDHSYDGVKWDFFNYSPMGNTTALHDINGVEAGVERFWNEIKNADSEEIRYTYMGVGIARRI